MTLQNLPDDVQERLRADFQIVIVTGEAEEGDYLHVSYFWTLYVRIGGNWVGITEGAETGWNSANSEAIAAYRTWKVTVGVPC